MRAAHTGAPIRSEFDPAAAIPRATAAVLLLDRIAEGPLDLQVGGLVRSLIPTAAARVLDVTGWAGGAPLTTTQVAARDRTGRETVARARRQILQRLPRRPWLPALDAAGALLSCLAPVSADSAARRLRDAGITDRLYTPAALLDLADRLGFGWQLELLADPAGDVVVSSREAKRLRRSRDEARRLRARDLAAARGRRIIHDSELPPAARRAGRAALAEAGALPDLVILPDQWIGTLTPPGRGAFDRLLRAMFAVNHTLPVSTLNDGLRRGMAGAGQRWTVPDHVLAAYLTHRPDAVVDDDRVSAVDPPPPGALTSTDQRLVSAVRTSPSGTLRYHQVVAAYTAAGGTPGTARVQLAQTAALERVARGVYAARGDAAARCSLVSGAAGELTAAGAEQNSRRLLRALEGR
jgi:hypothetical protein